ncbi:polyprenyl synthetase family protein [Nocardia alni]|uniref:polyprenyl synthetase family protein n=1 Tax=Nocardia alni TaxID=2815723 RepID=UPI001C23B072|nr:polyprenyl synthetase family protein [Nocardia alni]
MSTTVRSRERARTAADVLADARCVMGTPRRPAARLRSIGLDDAATPGSAAGIDAALPAALVFGAAKAAGSSSTGECRAEAAAVGLLCDFSALHEQPPAAGGDGPSAEHAADSHARDMVLTRVVNELVGRPSSTVVARVLAALSNDPDRAAQQAAVETAEDGTPASAARSAAVLMSCACEMGAIAAHATAADRATLAGFGHHIGLGFQLTQDLLGIWGNPSVTGRPMYGDIADRVESPPITVALQADSPVARELCELYAGECNDTSTLHRMACMIELAGGRSWANRQLDHHLTTARECLSALSPSADTEDLALLTGMIAGRAS